jgi:ketosteroid isomerase-like protein
VVELHGRLAHQRRVGLRFAGSPHRSHGGGVASFFGDINSSIEISAFKPRNFTAGDDDVHLLVDWTFRPLATGREASMTMQHYWRLRDGMVEQFRGSEDSAVTAAAFAA